MNIFIIFHYDILRNCWSHLSANMRMCFVKHILSAVKDKVEITLYYTVQGKKHIMLKKKTPEKLGGCIKA